MDPVFLRTLEQPDVANTHRWHNDAALYETLTSPFRYVSRQAEEEWLKAKQVYSTSEISLAICLSSSGEHIGNIYLQSIDWVARHGELAMFIGETTHRFKGYGRSALLLLMKHAFENLALQRLYLSVLEQNLAAVRLYKRCGLTVEGKLRKHAFKAGSYQDVLIMGVLQEDFVALNV